MKQLFFLFPSLILFLFTLTSVNLSSENNPQIDAYSMKDDVDVNRKFLRFKYALRDLNGLPYSDTDFANDVLPLVKSKNQEVAPHLELTEYQITEENKTLITTWISSYPEEFTNFIDFLETFNRSHF